METSTWREAQRNERNVWHRTVGDIAGIFSEIGDTASLVAFGKRHGLEACQHVLELGIGPLGIGWSALTPTVRAVGVDPLALLKSNTRNESVDRFVGELQRRTEFLQADATQQLPLDPASFDLVVCENVVDHTQDPGAILKEARRLVRPDGRLLFGVNVFSLIGIMKWRHVTRRLHPRAQNVLCHPHSFVEGDLEDLLSGTGWRVLFTDAPKGIIHRLVGHSYPVRAIARPV